MSNKIFTGCFFISALLWQDTLLAATSSQAIIDWNKSSFQLIDLSGGKNSPVLSWSSKTSSVTSYASSAAPLDYEQNSRTTFGLNKAITADAETEYTQSNAVRNNNFLYAAASSEPGELTDIKGINFASSSAENTGYFSLSGMGWLLISMNWSVLSSGAYGNEASETSNANVSINSFYNGPFSSGSASSEYSTVSGDHSKNGVFTMGFANFGEGIVTGYISAIATAFSSSNTHIATARQIYDSEIGGNNEDVKPNKDQDSNENAPKPNQSDSDKVPESHNSSLDDVLKYDALGVKPVVSKTPINNIPPLSTNAFNDDANNKIPEPTTFALIGIGVGISGIGKRHDRKVPVSVEA